MSFILALVPSWLSAAMAGFAILAGAAALLYALLPVVPYARVATVAGAGLLAAGCWFSGLAAGQAASEAEALRQSLADAQARLVVMQAQQDALHRDSLTAAAQAADITALMGQADALSSRAPAGACLDAATADGLRSLWPR